MATAKSLGLVALGLSAIPVACLALLIAFKHLEKTSYVALSIGVFSSFVLAPVSIAIGIWAWRQGARLLPVGACCLALAGLGIALVQFVPNAK